MSAYDPAKSKLLLSFVGAFSSMPNGEQFIALADQLKEAEAEIGNANTARLKAESEANKYATELSTVQATIRALREENEALKAAAPKAPKKARATKVAPVIELPATKKAAQ